MKKIFTPDYWGVVTKLEVVKIFIVFSIAGMLCGFTNSNLLSVLGVTVAHLGWVLFIISRVLLVCLEYHVFLFLVSVLLLQRRIMAPIQSKLLKRTLTRLSFIWLYKMIVKK